ncbi:MAG: MarR family transcriptional regulator [Thalassolituus sp.]|jgi:DNA-binding MarR family transcriptional regulator|nr:MarR family winged helix-turn-helix transcriptional regulator [Pseudomonadota bacterium]TNC84031.1 MAG: MarR family transcriptional regulator [Thalassolituus sp.]
MDNRLFFLLNMAQKKLFRHMDQVCERELDASVTQLAALMVIAKREGCQQKDLAAALQLNKSAVTGLVSRMEKNGLLLRAVPKDDARAVVLSVTPGGLEKINSLKPLIGLLNEQFQQEFSEEELQTILRFLNFIMARF